jgi:hypothetical protein
VDQLKSASQPEENMEGEKVGLSFGGYENGVCEGSGSMFFGDDNFGGESDGEIKGVGKTSRYW